MDMHARENLQKTAIKRRLARFQDVTKRLGPWGWWGWVCMKASGLPLLGRWFTVLAGLPFGSFRSKKELSRIRTYISPQSQISCNQFEIGKHCFIDDFVTIYGTDGRIELKDRVAIYRGTIIEAREGGEVIIGEDSFIEPNCILDGIVGSLYIGKDVMIAAYCSFVSAQHVFSDPERPMRIQGLVCRGDIVIEDDVWMGMGVRVMDGVRIGRGSIVGANAVVTEDIPPYSIAVGVPARVIRQRGIAA